MTPLPLAIVTTGPPGETTTATVAEATGDTKVKKIIFLSLFGSGLIVLMYFIWRFSARGSMQKQQYGRLNEIARDEAWTNQSARQTYRKSQKKQENGGQGGAGTESEEDPNALLAFGKPAARTNFERVVRVDPGAHASEPGSEPGSSVVAAGATSHRDRRGVSVTSQEAHQTTRPPSVGDGAGEDSGSQGASSYRARRSQASRSQPPATVEAAAPTGGSSYRDRRGQASKQQATDEQTEI